MGRILCLAVVLLWGCDRGANYITNTPDEGPPVDIATDLGTDSTQEDSTDSTDSTVGSDISDTGSEVADTATEDVLPDIAVDTGPVACDPPLSIVPKDAHRLVLQLVQFSVTGGTGSYAFELVDNPSGPMLEPVLGSYLAGVITGVTDRVRVTDSGCVGSDEASVTIDVEMTVLPRTVELGPAMGFQIDVSDGSGSFGYSLTSNASGGTISPTGVYTAGPEAGADVIEVLDLETEQLETIIITVSQDAQLVAVPATVVLPLHEPIRPQMSGGSGVFRYESTGTLLDHGDGRIEANAVGAEVVTVEDVYTGQSTTLYILAVESTLFPAEFVGMRGDVATAVQAGQVVVAGDLNGDGFEDVVLAVYEAGIDEAYEGVVFVYKGGPSGLDPTPAQVLRGGSRERLFGWSVDVADFNADGIDDVAVGILNDTESGAYSGAVEVFHGIEGDFFETSPSQRFVATSAWDYYGHSLTSCDFNHDGYMDLAIGAPWENGVNGTTDNGAVFIHLGSSDGLAPSASQVLVGRSPSGIGTWNPLAAAFLGFDMDSGDVNGDTICDLVVSGRNDKSGAVFLHLGVIDSGAGQGGLTSEPYLAWNGDHASFEDAYFGWSVAVGDISDDGYADIIIGARYDEYSTGQSCTSNPDCNPSETSSWCYTHKVNGANVQQCSRMAAGAVYVKLGSDLPLNGLEDWSSFDSFDRIYWGSTNWDLMGNTVHTADVDGDGIKDVLITSVFGGVVGSARPGKAEVFRGVAGAPPEETAYRTLENIHPEDYSHDRDYFGHGLGVLSDVDSDGVKDYFVYEARDDHYGHDVGRPYVVSGAVGENEEDVDIWYPLDLPIIATGHEYGCSVGLLSDINGDGYPELAVGAQHDSHINAGRDGSVYIYAGTADGFDTAAPVQMLRSPQIKTADYQYDLTSFGHVVADGGDFDQDGSKDLLVVARREPRPGILWTDYQEGQGVTTCGGAVGYASAVYIYSDTAEGFFSENPTFVYYGTQAWQGGMRDVLGGLDINGDDYDDVLVSGRAWDFLGRANAGGAAVLYGRPTWSADKINVICSADTHLHGAIASDEMHTMAAMGDLNNDGCDDFAIGAPYDDHAKSNAGSVHVVFGWGESCIFQEVHRISLAIESANAWMGVSLAGGHDADGDGVDDLLVGGTGYRVNNTTYGAVYFVSGSRILEYTPEAWTMGSRPTTLHSLANDEDTNLIVGDVVSGEFGAQVAFLPGVASNGNAAIAVSHPKGAIGGAEGTGGAHAYAVEADGSIVPAPILTMHGEPSRPVGQLGFSMDTSASAEGGAIWVISGPTASGAGIGRGAVYGLRIPAP